MTNKKTRTFMADRRGNVGIAFAFIAVPLIAFVGSAVDYGSALRTKTKLQSVVDIAAAAGARLPATSNANRQTAVLNAFNANATSSGLSAGAPTINATNAQVTVSANATISTAFLGLIGVTDITVHAESSARSQIENGGVACLISLSETASEGLHMQGINKFASQNCWAWVNSKSTTSLEAVGAAQGTAQGFCTAGKVVGPEQFHPTPYTECDPFADPFKDKLPAPASLDCTYNNKQVKSGYEILQPGVYCGGLSLKPQAVANLQPGVYVIKGGELEVQAQSMLMGNGVVFYFTGQNTGIRIRGGGSVVVKAPATGDYAGFIMVQDATSNPGQESEVQGGGRLKIEGIVYTPTWRLSIGGNGELNQEASYFALIADSFKMEGNGRLHIKSDADAAGLPNRMPRIKNGPVILK
ncbi:MAG: pilus assembly protein [Hyphomicrobiaceae bacterium]|nr:pilus assembly protein [Hyphomicrobiaceae bacterium]